jgi:hypothetical protein
MMGRTFAGGRKTRTRPVVVLDNVSLKLLLKQKKALLECNMPDREKDGLLNLLDYIHDKMDPPEGLE